MIAHPCLSKTMSGTFWSTRPASIFKAIHRCGIYHTRPQICRDYSTDNCEFDEDAVYEMYFETAEQVGEYSEARYLSDSASIRSPEPEPLPILN